MFDSSAQWRVQREPPKCFSNDHLPFQVNIHEFGAVFYSDDSFGKFNVVSNEWSNILMPNTLSTNQKIRRVFGHDVMTKTLYAVDDGSNGSRLKAFDSETGCIRVLLSDLPIVHFKGYLIGDDIHLFGKMVTISGNDDRTAHLILNKNLEENQSYDRLHVFAEESGLRNLDIWASPFTFCETRNTFLSIRPEAVALNKDIITEYCFTTKEVKTRECSGLSLRHWTSCSGFVCTADGRYLLILGGKFKTSWYSDEILVYDLNELSPTPKTSALKCPIKAWFSAILMRDKKREELSTFGFVHQCYKKQEMKDAQHLPQYIIELIAKWVEMEYLYLLQKRGSGHWRINVEDILKSVI